MRFAPLTFLVSVCIIGINGHMFSELFEYYASHFNVSDAPTLHSESPASDAIIKTITCVKQNEVSDKTIHEMMEKKEFLSTEVINSFPSCIAKNFGLMNEDGTLSKAYTENSTQVEKCKHLGGKDQNEIAAKMIECILNDGN